MSEVLSDEDRMELEGEEQVLIPIFSDDELRCHLDMLRAIDDDIYCMVFEKQSENFYLYRLKFWQDDSEEEKLSYSFNPVNIATIGEIIAFELDPLQSNDYNPTDWTEDLEDLDDYIFIIDSQYMLSKVNVSKESYVMLQIDLSEFKSLRGQIDEYAQQRKAGKPVRMSISDRCITINGRTFNLETGYEWSAIIHQREDHELDFQWH